MHDKELVLDIISTLEEVLHTIQQRTVKITSPEDFLISESGMILLDAICMKLVAVGESVKKNRQNHQQKIAFEISTY